MNKVIPCLAILIVLLLILKSNVFENFNLTKVWHGYMEAYAAYDFGSIRRLEDHSENKN